MTNQIQSSKSKKIMTHIIIGFPSLKKSEELIDSMAKSGISMIELQIPFTDSLADGPVISKACEKALSNGVKVSDSFKLMKKVSDKYPNVNFYFMTYYNIIFNYGVDKFCKIAKKSGAKGLIVPDIPIDEEKNEKYYVSCKKNSIDPIFVVSPITPEKRLKEISKYAKGFLYCTSTTGTTGVREKINPKLKSYIKLLRKIFKMEIAVGFGISTKEHVKEVHKYADIAVIGSAVIKLIQDKFDVDKAERFIKNLK